MSARCGFVAVVGRPNVGKSTLVNRILGQKLCDQLRDVHRSTVDQLLEWSRRRFHVLP